MRYTILVLLAGMAWGQTGICVKSGYQFYPRAVPGDTLESACNRVKGNVIVTGPGVACEEQPAQHRMYCHISDKADHQRYFITDWTATDEHALGEWIEKHCWAEWAHSTGGMIGEPRMTLHCDGGKK